MHFKFKNFKASAQSGLSLVVLSALFCAPQSIKAAPNTVILQDINVTAKREIYDESELEGYLKSGSYLYLDDTKIQRFRGSSVGDFLSGIPGVMAGNKRNSGAITPIIRGIANENRVPVLIDDSLQSIPSWQGYAGSSTRTYLDPDLISKVEIEKGPSLKADATGATGGVVRMNTVGYKDIIPEDKDWGFRLRLGTMSNTTNKPALYTRGGYRTKWIDECYTNRSGKCPKQTYNPDAKYSSKNPFHNIGKSYNYSIAFSKKWENADVVLAYAKKKQGNYFVGRHGAVPVIEKIEYKDEEDFEVYRDPKLKNRFGRPLTYEEDVRIGRLKFKEQNGYTYFRGGEEVLNTSQDNQSYLAKLNTYNDAHALNLTYRGYRSKFGELMPSITSFRGDGALQGEGTEVKTDSYSAKYIFDPENPFIKLALSGYYTKSDTSSFTPFIEDLVDFSSRHAHFTISEQKGTNLSNTSVAQIFDKPLTLNYGIGYSRERIYPPKNMADRVRAKGYPDNAVAPFYIRNARRAEKSAFFSLNYPLIDWLKLDFGLRHINAKIHDYQPRVEDRYFNKNAPDPQNSICEPVPRNPFQKRCRIYSWPQPPKVKATSPIVMLTFEPHDSTQIYVKYAQAVRSASLFQASRGFSTQIVDYQTYKLKPERQKNWELGTNLIFDDVGGSDNVLGLKFAYFRNFTKDYLTRTNTRGRLQTVNIKSALYRGYETSAYFDMRSFYTQIGVTHYIRTRFCRKPEQLGLVNDKTQCYNGGVSGSNIANTLPPKTTITTTLGFRFWGEKLELGARHSYYSKRVVSIFSTNNSIGETNSAEWKPYALVDLFANYKISKDLIVSATLDNLTNRYYLDANNMGLNPAPGRTLRLNLDYKF